MIQPADRRPTENETVFFYVDDGKLHIACQIHDRTGWHMGWWSGTRWHSYFDGPHDRAVAWAPIELPMLHRKPS